MRVFTVIGAPPLALGGAPGNGGYVLEIGGQGPGQFAAMSWPGAGSTLGPWVGLSGQSSPLGDSFAIDFAPWLVVVGCFA